MITFLKGDLFNSPAQVLVNTVNTVGVMGKGVALEFKKRYPEMFSGYQRLCQDNRLDIGKLYLWKSTDKWVLLFPTKKHWRSPSKLEYVEAGLQTFVNHWQSMGVESIAFPRLGCGNGGLDWKEVQPIMKKYLDPLPIPVFIYVDNYRDSKPEHKQPDLFTNWLHLNPDAIGFSMLKEELQQMLSEDDTIVFSDGKKRHITWEGETITITNGATDSVSEDDFCELWDYARNAGVITLDQLPEYLSAHSDILLELLKKLDYLQDVVVSKDGIDFTSHMNGYQYIKADSKD